MMRGEVQAHDFDTPVQVEENATVDKYSISEPQKQVSECLDRVGETAAEDLVVSSPIVMNTTRDPTPASATEPVDGPPRQTYASIVLTVSYILFCSFRGSHLDCLCDL